MLFEISRLLCLEWGMVPLSDESPIFILTKDDKEYILSVCVATASGSILSFEPLQSRIEPQFIAMLVLGKSNDNFIVVRAKKHIDGLHSGAIDAKQIVDDIIYKNRIEYE